MSKLLTGVCFVLDKAGCGCCCGVSSPLLLSVLLLSVSESSFSLIFGGVTGGVKLPPRGACIGMAKGAGEITGDERVEADGGVTGGVKLPPRGAGMTRKGAGVITGEGFAVGALLRFFGASRNTAR